MTVQIKSLAVSEMQQAQEFYETNGYRGDPITGTDRVFLAWHGDEIVGIGRLSKEFGHLCLRGMRIKPSYQRQGIGTQILEQIVRIAGDEPCYCLPYSHLEDFYALGGFRLQSPQQLPDYLQKRLTRYIDSGMQIIGMARLPGNAQ